MATEQEVIDIYKNTDSIRTTAKMVGIALSTVRKILITADEYTSEKTLEILRLQESGLSTEEIAKELNCTISSIHGFLPYSKGSYAVGEKSKNALRIAACRRKKAEGLTQYPASTKKIVAEPT